MPAAPVPVVLGDGRGQRPGGPGPLRRALVRFGFGTAVALVVLVVVGLALLRGAAEREGVREARRVTGLIAHAVVEPALTEELGRGDARAAAAFDEVVRAHLVGATDVLRVKLWSLDGRVVYSDDPRLIGDRYAFGEDEIAVLRTGQVEAEVSGLERPENQFERGLAGRLLEVYTPVRTADGTTMLLEIYYSYDVITARRGSLLGSFAWISLAALVVFAAVQLPLAWSSLRSLHRERERLVEDAARVSERERLRIAGDLHDGTVQELLGASLIVSGAVNQVRAGGRADLAEGLRHAAESIRTSVQSLRNMIVDIYPSSLRSAGLRAALSDLVAPLRGQGTQVDIDLEDDTELPQDVQELVYRVAQEAVRNVTRHARAAHVRVHVATAPDHVSLDVSDDGVGFDPAQDRDVHHVGLRALADLVAARGGLVTMTSAPGDGTSLHMEVPL